MLVCQSYEKISSQPPQDLFLSLGGFRKLDSVLRVILDTDEQRPCVLPAKSLALAGKVS